MIILCNSAVWCDLVRGLVRGRRVNRPRRRARAARRRRWVRWLVVGGCLHRAGRPGGRMRAAVAALRYAVRGH